MSEVTANPGDAETQPVGLGKDEVLTVECRGVKWRSRMLTYGEFLAYQSGRDALLAELPSIDSEDADGKKAWSDRWDAWARGLIADCIVGWGETKARLEGENLDRVMSAEAGKAAAELAGALMESQGSTEALWAGFR